MKLAGQALIVMTVLQWHGVFMDNVIMIEQILVTVMKVGQDYSVINQYVPMVVKKKMQSALWYIPIQSLSTNSF